MLELKFSPLLRVCQSPKRDTLLSVRNVVRDLDCSITDQRELNCVPVLQVESVAEMVGADQFCIDAGSADPREAENTL